jgi:DNA-binding CsgD family transcriptional regulator
VEFHFAGIRSKLAASNRQEAIAKGMSAGLILPQANL